MGLRQEHRITYADETFPACSFPLPEAGLHELKQCGLAAEAGPVFGDDDGVAGIVGIVFHAGRKAEAAGVEIGELAQPGYVLRALVLHAGDIVLIDEQLCGNLDFAVHLLHVDDGAVAKASLGAKAFAAFELELSFALTASAQQKEGSAYNDGASANSNGIENAERHRQFEITPRNANGASDGHPKFEAGSS